MTREQILSLAQALSPILQTRAPDRSDQARAVVEAHGARGDWPSIRDLLVEAETPPTEVEIAATLKYILCVPISFDERRHVVGANGLFFGQDDRGRRKVGGTAKSGRNRG